jgi:hypothetical protein
VFSTSPIPLFQSITLNNNVMYRQQFGLILVLMSALVFTGCHSEQELTEAKDEGQRITLNKVDDALGACEQGLDGVLMDDGCLEDVFSYHGDYWDCEVSRPSETLVDADCVRSELGL